MESPFSQFLPVRLQARLSDPVPVVVTLSGVPIDLHATADGAAGAAGPLRVDVRAERSADGRCTEWTTVATNTGDAIIEDLAITPVRLTFDLAEDELPRVRHLSGSWHYDAIYPPRAFRLHDESFVTHDHARPIAMGGSNAMEHSPLLQLGVGAPLEAAIFVALEWSGGWQLDAGWATPSFNGEPRPAFAVTGTAKLGALVLQPGESVHAPVVHVGGVSAGDWSDLDREQRRHLRDLMPSSGLPALPVSYDSWFGRYDTYDLATLMADADTAAALGVEAFCLDAGWYLGETWFDGIGNWHTPNLARFPRGEADIVALADHVRSLGMKFGLWHLIQLANPGTEALVERPELFRRADDSTARAGAQAGGDAVEPAASINPWILALEQPAAVEYALGILEGWIERWGVEWFRFESTPGDGLAYNEGYNRVLDELRSRHPELYIEECNGGGQRLDVNSVRRTHGTWLSDHTSSPEVTRFQQTGAARFWPSRMLNMAVTAFAGSGDRQATRYEAISRMAGVLSFDGAISEWSDEATRELRAAVDAYKGIRHLIDRDAFFPLPQPRSVDDWDAVAYTSDDRAETVLLVYRVAGADVQRIQVPWLDGAEPELVIASDGRASIRRTDGTIEVALPPRGAGVWRFSAR